MDYFFFILHSIEGNHTRRLHFLAHTLSICLSVPPATMCSPPQYYTALSRQYIEAKCSKLFEIQCSKQIYSDCCPKYRCPKYLTASDIWGNYSVWKLLIATPLLSQYLAEASFWVVVLSVFCVLLFFFDFFGVFVVSESTTTATFFFFQLVNVHHEFSLHPSYWARLPISTTSTFYV